MAANSNLVEVLQQSIDKTDPTQKLIGLLAVLVDNKFNELNETVGIVQGDIYKQNDRIDTIDHNKSCPFNMNTRMDKLEASMQPILFIDKYPKLAVLMVIGFLALMGLGADRVVNFFIK